MFSKKILFPFYALYVLRFLVTFGIVIVALIAFFIHPSVLYGLAILLSLLYRFTWGQQIDDAIILKTMRIFDPILIDCMKQGDVSDIRQIIRTLKVIAFLSIPGFPYGLTHRYRIYVFEVLLNPYYQKHRDWLIRQGTKHFLSDDGLVISDFFQTVFFQLVIAKDFANAGAFLYNITQWYVPMDATKFESVEMFHHITGSGGVVSVLTLPLSIGFLSTGNLERVINRFRPRFDRLLAYIADPTDDQLSELTNYFDTQYTNRKALVYRAMMEVASWLKHEDHATKLRQKILALDTDLPIVMDIKKSEFQVSP